MPFSAFIQFLSRTPKCSGSYLWGFANPRLGITGLHQTAWRWATLQRQWFSTTIQKSVQVREPLFSGFQPFMINYFSAIISSFRDRFRRIAIRPRGWLVRWLLGRSFSAQSSSVLQWVRLIAFALQNSGEAVLLCAAAIHYRALHAFWCYFILLLLVLQNCWNQTRTLHPKWTALLVTPVFMTLFMQLEGVEQNKQLTAIPAALRTYSAATAPRPFPVQMTRDHSSQMKLSFQLRRCSSCLTPLPLSLPSSCQGVPWQRRSFWTLAVRKCTYCGTYGKEARYLLL